MPLSVFKPPSTEAELIDSFPDSGSRGRDGRSDGCWGNRRRYHHRSRDHNSRVLFKTVNFPAMPGFTALEGVISSWQLTISVDVVVAVAVLVKVTGAAGIGIKHEQALLIRGASWPARTAGVATGALRMTFWAACHLRTVSASKISVLHLMDGKGDDRNVPQVLGRRHHRMRMDWLERDSSCLHCTVSASRPVPRFNSQTYIVTLYNMQSPDPKAKLAHWVSALHFAEQAAKVASVPLPPKL